MNTSKKKKKRNDYVNIQVRREFIEKLVDPWIKSGVYRSRAHFFEETVKQYHRDNTDYSRLYT